jgi:endonuclease/exonuclease/phosphatase family metal-dependent hydrolase
MRIFGILRSLPRRLLRALSRLWVPTVLPLNALSLVGFFVRDRSLLLAFLLYLPLLPLGVCSVGLGLGLRRSISRRLCDVLIMIGLVSIITCSSWMLGRGPGAGTTQEPQSRTLSLLHWNVQWGRYWNRPQNEWKAMVTEIVSHNPDILVLSEAPPYYGMYRALDRLPGHRFVAFVQNNRATDRHTYHLFVLARWPVRLIERVRVSNGAAAVVQVDHPERPVRLLFVDGQSRITVKRTPMLHDIASACSQAYNSSEPIDLVVGDFNAVSRSIGFDALENAGRGYLLASRSCEGWRGSWPSFFPLFDIDHVWVRSDWSIVSCRLFTNFASDHRGQVVRLDFPKT